MPFGRWRMTFNPSPISGHRETIDCESRAISCNAFRSMPRPPERTRTCGTMPVDGSSNGEKAIRGGVGEALAHESAHLHVTGESLYADDIALPAGTLHAAIGISDRAYARIRKMDLSAVRAAPEVVAVLTIADIPGENNHGPVGHDDPILT